MCIRDRGYTDGGELILSEDDAEQQITLLPRSLGEGPFEHRYSVLTHQQPTRNKLFFSNGSGNGFELEGFEISVKQYFE